MTNYSNGRAAEAAAAEHLKKLGYEIVAQNWRTPLCEIDIVVKKKRVLTFVEVKYRKTDAQGSGLEYITEKKLKQMRFAAELWVSENKWEGEYSLAAIEVSGQNFQVSSFVTDLL